jgi:hypothetical protein
MFVIKEKLHAHPVYSVLKQYVLRFVFKINCHKYKGINYNANLVILKVLQY